MLKLPMIAEQMYASGRSSECSRISEDCGFNNIVFGQSLHLKQNEMHLLASSMFAHRRFVGVLFRISIV